MRRRATVPASADPSPAAAGAIDSLQRGLALLRCFLPGEASLHEKELARRVALPPRTVRRLLSTLVAHGFLVRSPDGDAFGLHVACFVVGQAVLDGSNLVRRGTPALRTLAQRFGGHALLAVPDGDALIVVAHVVASDSADAVPRTGTRVAIDDTALGHAWLWTQPMSVQGEWLARVRASGPSSAARLWKSFESIEEHGACRHDDPVRRGGTVTAAPLGLRDGTTAALGCTCAPDDAAACVAAVAETATALVHEIVADGR